MSTVGAWLDAHRDLDRRDREVLLCRAAGLSRAQVLARPERDLDPASAGLLADWARRRRQGEPVAYIVGSREFWGLELEVTPAVLIPRPETELLVETALALAAPTRRACRILELGTGSGAVAIALATEAAARGLPLEVTATDVSAEALSVAIRNARRHRVSIRWLESDWFGQVSDRFDLVLSNPPYVAAGDPHLAALAREPRRALVAGADGLDAIRTIASGAPDRLVPGGCLVLEHGCDQGAAVRALLRQAGFSNVATARDLAGLERVTRGTSA